MSSSTALLYGRCILVLGALTLITLGILFLVQTEAMASLIELELTTPLARGDIQTVYGGLELGLGLLPLFWLGKAEAVRRGLELHLAVWGGLAGGRAISLLCSEAPLQSGIGLFSTELVGLALGWSAWLVVRRFAQ